MANSYFQNLNNNGIPFMEGRTKGSMNALINQTVHIDNFGFINGTDGEYAVFTVAEDPQNFYFGGVAITDTLRKIEKDNMSGELANQALRFIMKTGKTSKRNYVGFEFV